MPKSVVIGILALLATLWVGCTQSEPTSTLVPTPKLVAIPTRTAHTHAHCHTYAHITYCHQCYPRQWCYKCVTGLRVDSANF